MPAGAKMPMNAAQAAALVGRRRKRLERAVRHQNQGELLIETEVRHVAAHEVRFVARRRRQRRPLGFSATEHGL